MYVWSLLRKTVACIKHPKFSDSQGCLFTRDGQHMVVLTRTAGTDTLSIYALSTWSLSYSVALPTSDCQFIQLASDFILVADEALDYNVYLYDLHLAPLKHYSPYKGRLGVRCAALSPSGAFAAVGSYDGCVRALNSITWDATYEFQCTPTLPASPLVAAAAVYREQYVDAKRTAFQVVSPPLALPTPMPDPDRAEAPAGVWLCEWSAQERYLAVVSAQCPCTVWVLDVQQGLLAAAATVMAPVAGLAWDPVRAQLAFCAGTDKLYLWSPEGCSVVCVPSEGMRVGAAAWGGGGDMLLLSNDSSFSVCFIK
jgi:WD40 repeat protein